MTEFVLLIAAGLAGGFLAALWLTGLWFDVKCLSASRRPYRRLLVGALARWLAVAAGFVLILTISDHWRHVLSALAGFLVVRFLVIYRVRRRQHQATARSGGLT
ncbi:MAG TPA: ATP synthase subunit I [Wenzhouxiangella sp.]|nr:ATP synthase subunit I [Wenzhouxiangella sp.]